jgi:L-asparaginase
VLEAQDALQTGKHRHDVLERMLNLIEDDITIDNVGYGGYPNLLGDVELDAAFMDGNDRMLGAIAAIRNFAHPSSIARKLMEKGLHTMLCGEGAELFAREHGFQSATMLTEDLRKRWERDMRPFVESRQSRSLLDTVRQLAYPQERDSNDKAHDTALMIASDGSGISAATSTSGWAGKHPGRVGDSSISGAGFYVDSRFGACACTHTGEMTMRAGTSRLVVAQLGAGKTIREAVDSAIDDLSTLRHGHIGGLAIHAVDAKGQERVVAVNIDEPIKYAYWHETLANVEYRTADAIAVQTLR